MGCGGGGKVAKDGNAGERVSPGKQGVEEGRSRKGFCWQHTRGRGTMLADLSSRGLECTIKQTIPSSCTGHAPKHICMSFKNEVVSLGSWAVWAYSITFKHSQGTQSGIFWHFQANFQARGGALNHYTLNADSSKQPFPVRNV